MHPAVKILLVHAGPEQVCVAVEQAGPGWIVVGGHTDDKVDRPIEMTAPTSISAFASSFASAPAHFRGVIWSLS